MMSAVAARKAALAANSQFTAEEPAVASGSQNSSPAPSNIGTTKRKYALQKSRAQNKKPRKGNSLEKPKLKPESRTRDDFVHQADMIVVEDSDDDLSDAALSMMEEDDDIQEPVASIRRAWSPSQPVEDSSDEDMLPDSDPKPIDISSLFPNNSALQKQVDVDAGPWSTFEPLVDENVFYLTESELTLIQFSEPTTLVILNSDVSLCLLGTCRLAVLQGSLFLSGAVVTSSRFMHHIYAPRSSPLPILKTAKWSASPSILTSSNLSPRLQHLLDCQVVVAIQESQTGVEGLGLVCRTFDGVFEPSRRRSSTVAPFGIPGIFMVTKPTKESHPFVLPSSWSAALDSAISDLKTGLAGTHVVKGPKNSGKSTFARTLMNHLLNFYQRVAYLECDIGQSEFTPGGMVSLHVISTPMFGPPFTHPTLSNYAHYIGSTTPRSNPSLYLDAIHALVQTYRLDIQTPAIDIIDENDSRMLDVIPLVVNTMGWTKGLGADLTENIVNAIEATHIYDVQALVREEYRTSGAYGAYHSEAMETSTALVHTLEAMTSLSTIAGYTAADHRALAILSYFHARFPLDIVPSELAQVTALKWDTTRPLCAIPPYEVDCKVAFDRVVLTGSGSEDVVEAEISRVVNGALVGLVQCEAGTVNRPENIEPNGIPYTRGYSPPSPVSSTCVGLALVRAIATEESAVYLHMLTPLPHALLARARVLVKGEMELPVWGMLDFRNFSSGQDTDPGEVAGVEREKVPYLQWGRAPEGVLGADRRRVRRNLLRRGQM